MYCIALTSQRATTIRCHSYLRLEPLFQTHLLATTEDLTLRVYANANVAFIRHIPFGKASQEYDQISCVNSAICLTSLEVLLTIIDDFTRIGDEVFMPRMLRMPQAAMCYND